MSSHWPRALFLLTTLLSLFFVSCFGGHGGGGGGSSPVFQVTVAHTGNFQKGQQNATYTITVTNVGAAASVGNVQVNITIPSGETLVSTSGSGWTAGGPVANRTDTLAVGQSWPSITVTVNVAINATSPQVLMVSVAGGGAAGTANAQDSTTITSPNVSILFGRYAFFFSGFDANGAVAVAGSINVDQSGNVTGEEDFKDPTTLHTAVAILGFCQDYPVANTGFCKLTAANTTYQYDFVLRNSLLVGRFFENPVDGLNITGSGLLLSQQVPNSNALITPGGFNGYFSVSFVGTDAATPEGRIGVEGNIFFDLNGALTSPVGVPSQADINDNSTLIQPASSTTPNVTGNFTGANPPTVDANGRATMTMTISSQKTLTLAVYIVAPVNSTNNNNGGRALAVDITPVATNKQVLSGQFFWQGAITPAYSNSSISGVNVFALWGVVPGTPGPPATPASSNTAIGILNAATNQLLFDANTAGQVNGGGGVASPLRGTVSSITVANNGRAQLSVMVGSTTYSYILYLDAANDGNLLQTGGDNTVSFGFLTGQAPTSRFDNTRVTGTYVAGTSMPVLPGVPNAASPFTLTPTGQSGMTFSGNFAAGSTNGTYSFVQATGRGTALASSGQLFQNSSAVFYIITPNIMVVMGADQGVKDDAIGLIQF